MVKGMSTDQSVVLRWKEQFIVVFGTTEHLFSGGLVVNVAVVQQ